MTEWNGGVDYWSGVLDWTTGVPRSQNYSIRTLFHGLIFRETTENRSNVVWGATLVPRLDQK